MGWAEKEPTTIDAKYVLEALAGHNYFPTQKGVREELPPSVHSELFTRRVVNALVASQERQSDTYLGHDVVEYRLTRFNGISRTCAIPHPAPYSRVIKCAHDNWESLLFTAENGKSRIPHAAVHYLDAEIGRA